MYTYKLEVTSIYDGDTLNGVVDLGFNIRMDIKVRLARINTPEIRTKDEDEKARGYEARDWLRAFCEKYKDGLCIKTTGKGKYGRWIGEILIPVDDYGYDGEMEKYEPCITGDYYVINDILVQEELAEYKEY
jgi:micrococcal nuclease